MSDLTFTEYQGLIAQTARYPNIGNNITYPVLGINGEAGEVAEKVKKIIRDKDGVWTPEDQAAICKELGDVLWYVTATALEFGLSLDHVAKTNQDKLLGRRERGTLHGSGDDR